MKQWIREHPWRLEIVPFAMIIAAVALGLTCRQASLAYLYREWLAAQAIEREWLSIFLRSLGWMIAVWTEGFSINHRWVRSERRKTFNYYAILNVAVVAAFIADGTFQLGPANVIIIWPLLSAIFLILQVTLELTRPLAQPQKRPQPPPIDVKPGEPFYYREQHFDWASSASLLVIGVLIATQELAHPWWRNLIPCVFVAAAWACFWQNTVITHQQVYRKSRFSRLRIPMPSIEKCAVIEVLPEESVRADGWSPWFLEIRTRHNTHYLALDHPETACRLIQTALASRAQSEEKS